MKNDSPIISDVIIEGMIRLAQMNKQDWWSLPERDATNYERKGIGLSQLTGCPRQLWFTEHQTPKTNSHDPLMELVWNFGIFFENYVMKALAAMNIPVLLRDETVFVNDISGHIDGLLDISDTDLMSRACFGGKRYWLLEVKTVKRNKFRLLTKDGAKSAAFDNESQMQAYFLGIAKTFPEYIDELGGGVYFAGNKGFEIDFVKGTATKPFYEELIEINTSAARALARSTRETLKMSEPPDIPFTEKPVFPCNFCDYQELCWGNSSEKEFSFFDLLS